MADSGVGTKFVSVNLNKSYGQPPSSLTNTGASRVRPGSHGSTGAGSGGMLVLSRHRSSIVGAQKAGSKLSVPSPFNLPSLRKEHERFDSSSGVSSVRPGSSGSGSRPTSSGMGWIKPVTSILHDKDNGSHQPLLGRLGGGNQAVDGRDHSMNTADGVSRASSGYKPPSARLGTVTTPMTGSASSLPPVEKVVVLRGEDFPSLRATLPVTSGSAQKQKVSVEASDEQTESSSSRVLLHMRPQVQSSHHTVGSGLNENGCVSPGSGAPRTKEHSRKLDDYFPGPLPLVRLNHTSDWTDDERETGHGRKKDHGFSRTEAFHGRDFDISRVAGLPRSHAEDLSDGRGLRGNDNAGKVSSREFLRTDSYGRDFRTPSREGQDGSLWRASSHTKDGFSVREVGIDRNGVGARPFSLNRDMNRDNKHNQSSIGDNYRDFSNRIMGTQDSRFGRRDLGYGQGNRQHGNHMEESFSSRGAEKNMRDRQSGDISDRHRGDASFSPGVKGLSANEPLLDFGREKPSFSNNGKPYHDDSFLKDFGSGSGFDGSDPFSGGLVGVFKKKKDVLKQTDFHDPVRESFEAELERVQKMQEQERQRILEAQERALELARKEEEDRERYAREEEERRRRLEEEAREAACRAEQERVEAARRAEEQKITREEEKQRILMEEERRKEAARQKLLELETRIARRQAEVIKDDKFPASIGDGRLPVMVKEKEVSREAEVGGWEDGERMVERITNSSSSDSSSLNRPFEIGYRPHSSRDGNSAFLDRGKPADSWRRDVFENAYNSTCLSQDHENGHRSPRRDAFGAGRAFPRKDAYGGLGVVSARIASKGVSEAHVVDDFPYPRGQRWNLHGGGDHYGRNSELDIEFHENTADRFGDMGWEQGHSHSSLHASYTERLYQNSEADGFSYGRSRHSMRQPRVLPPPSIASTHKSSHGGETEWCSSSAFLDTERRYHHLPRRSEPIMSTGYDGGSQEKLEQTGIIEAQHENAVPKKNRLDKPTTPGCDSQSSLSVSSPPISPTHLSHDDLDEPGDSPVLPAAAEGKEMALSDREHVPLATETGDANVITASSFVAPLEDEEWAIENNEELQQQEEYDEEEDGYQEEDEVLEGDDNENVDLVQEFKDLHMEEKDSSDKMDQLVLGFNEGVEVGIASSDKFERTSKNGEKAQVLVSIAEEPGSFDGLVGDGQSCQPENDSANMCVESFSKTIQEPEKALQDHLVIQTVDAAQSTATSADLPDTVGSAGSPSLLSQQTVVSPVNMDLPSSVQTVMSTVSAVPTQADGPVKLQFGLFSGPSLIPSPVTAIQIGSIQMPLHLHPQVGPSLTQIHPSQPPLFRFGQLTYPSPISQGILPLAPQSMSFVQPTVPGHYALNQNLRGPLHNQTGQDISSQIPTVKGKATSVLMDNQPGLVQKLLDLSQENVSKEVNLPAREIVDNEVLTSQSQSRSSILGEKKSMLAPISQDQRHHDLSVKNNRSISNNGESRGHLQSESNSSQFISSERALNVLKAPGPKSGGKGKKFIYTIKNSGSKSSFPVPEAAHWDTSGFQRSRRNIRRTEFRVQENGDRSQMETVVSTNSALHEKLNFNGKVSGIYPRTGAKKDSVSAKPYKQSIQSQSVYFGSLDSHMVDSESKMEKGQGKEAPTKRITSSLVISRSGEGNLKRNSNSEEDVDAPLQSGVVRVFKQSGIEAPSDEDDFIEVRSKRQMLNDRREQREKEIKAKSRVIKAPRKPRSVLHNAVVSNNSSKTPTSLGEAASNMHSESVVTDGRALPNVEVSPGYTSTLISQSLPPIGTPAVNTDVQAEKRSHNIKSLQTGSIPVISSVGTSLGVGLPLENTNVVLDNVQTSLASWSNVQLNQQVMALTQTQLDEAMNPARFDALVASIGDHASASAVIEASKPSPPILTQDKSYSSAASPLNSLLAGEKIQFGAVTSPTILPPGSRAVSNGIISPGACRSDQIHRSLSAAENDCTLFFEKENHPDESCIHLEDSEAEAEAAASAVAVAAISSDEIVGNGLGACCVSVSDAKTFAGADIDGSITGNGVTGDQRLAGQARGEYLTVALPADLSVDIPSLSIWPPMRSPQSSSSQLMSHFPGAPHSHFPCYEMNPMLAAPIFAFGPHDKSAGTQSQSQKSSAPASGPLGSWQQCHSGVDSFYGPPAGFTGPFIGPPGGITGVQGPPHMVVYNHFAPVGQFGQVGLSFMGATYIPSGKQPDWKHNPTSSAMGIGEADINNMNMVSPQRNTPSMPGPIQHLAPGSPLLPMASPLAMFDISPFQSSADIPVQAHWSHIPASPLHSVPLSMPLQLRTESVFPSQFSHGLSGDQTSTRNRFHDPHTSAPPDNNRNFSMAADATSIRLPDEIGLVDPSSSTTTTRVSTSRPTSNSLPSGNGKAQNVVTKNFSKGTITNACESGGIHNLSNSSSQSMTTAFKTQSSQQQTSSTQQYLSPTGYSDQRTGGVSQKASSGGDWSHRRMGFQGRNQSSGTDKNFASKMKQIYVAKPTSGGASATV